MPSCGRTPRGVVEILQELFEMVGGRRRGRIEFVVGAIVFDEL